MQKIHADREKTVKEKKGKELTRDLYSSKVFMINLYLKANSTFRSRTPKKVVIILTLTSKKKLGWEEISVLDSITANSIGLNLPHFP